MLATASFLKSVLSSPRLMHTANFAAQFLILAYHKQITDSYLNAADAADAAADVAFDRARGLFNLSSSSGSEPASQSLAFGS